MTEPKLNDGVELNDNVGRPVMVYRWNYSECEGKFLRWGRSDKGATSVVVELSSGFITMVEPEMVKFLDK